MATYNVGRVGVVAKGTYSAATSYTPLDMVTYQDSSYICKSPSMGNTPSSGSNYWMLAAQGAYSAAKTAGYQGTQSNFNADLAAMEDLAAQLASI